MSTLPEDYEPRSGDGSIAAEDDSLLRQPADGSPDDGTDATPADDPDIEHREAGTSTGADPVNGPDDPDAVVEDGAQSRP
jgi:hypothetical protein